VSTASKKTKLCWIALSISRHLKHHRPARKLGRIFIL
jgi:hypothetical protein